MNTLLSIVLAAILNQDMLPVKEVKFRDLPPECVAVYDAHLKKWRQAENTDVIYLDMNCDGQKEIIVWDGNVGSGGQGWHVMVKKDKTWKDAGEVFGDLAQVKLKNKNGLLVCHPCGWDEAGYYYYELKGDSLVNLFEINVKYNKPVRQEASKIQIKRLPEKKK